MPKEKILVIGSNGQIGTELVLKLREIHGSAQVIATDIKEAEGELLESGPFEHANVLDTKNLKHLYTAHKPTQVYLLAAMLSATGEERPLKAWELNMEGLINVLQFSIEYKTPKVYWPSSIAVFGPNTPRENTPQDCYMDPNTVYGISKQAGERWCEYYFLKHGLDVRSLRYPGIISYKSAPGGGTTDYAIHIFHEVRKQGRYTSFLDKGTTLPMMYMPDAIKATLDLMDAPAQKVKVRSSYNLAAISFAPEELGAAIKKHIPEFTLDYKPDHRQKIAESWPRTIDDSRAREDWGWRHQYDLEAMTADMLKHI